MLRDIWIKATMGRREENFHFPARRLIALLLYIRTLAKEFVAQV